MKGKLLFGFPCVGVPNYCCLCSANKKKKSGTILLAKFSLEKFVGQGKTTSLSSFYTSTVQRRQNGSHTGHF